LIKTYLHESGLFYLAKSLGDLLKSQGHTVIYIPKSKYLLDGSIFYRNYLKPNDETLLDGEIVHWFDERKTVENQVSNAIIKYDSDTIISFETLMEKSQWIYKVKRKHHVHMIDVPMIEWVSPNLLKGNSYIMFDQIWCLTEQCHNYFSDYKATQRVEWDLVDRDLFAPVEKEDGPVRYFHAASLNPEYSTKNTDLVIQAFDRFLKRDNPDATLTISGVIKNLKSQRIIEKHDNIHTIDGVLDRSAIADLYKESHCVLAPSSREGLGLSLYEAQACNCLIITTNLQPMNKCGTQYLCSVESTRKDQRLVPLAVLSTSKIYEQIKRAYGDIKCQK